MLKFQSRSLSTPDCSSLHSRDQPQKAVILKDSKATLQFLISNTPDQPNQCRKTCSFSHKNAPWSYSGSLPTVIPRNERAYRLAKSGSKQLQPLSTSTYQEAKTLLRNSQSFQWRRATGDYYPSTDPINHLARHEQTTIFRLRTGHCSLWTHHGLCTL